MVRTLIEAGVDSLPVEVAVLDADGTIVLVNETWRRFADENHGTHPDYWVGENYFEICEQAYSEPRSSEVLDGLKKVSAGSLERFRSEYPCHSPEEQRWYVVEASRFSHDGEPYLFLCHYDITERKLAEMRAAARTEQLETLIGVLTHDIRNPLQVIDGYVELIAEDLDDMDKAEGIRGAVARITELVETTLDFSRTGALTSVEPVSLAEVATDAWETVPTDDATLTVRDHATFHGDRRLLLQLFENVFRNAVEHAGPECTVTVGSLPDGFYIEDDGPGIPAELKERVVEMDFSTRGTGGLGLSIVQAVVRAHGGELVITDADGGGARFEVTALDVAPDPIHAA